MSVLNLYNKNSLREEPDLSLVADTSFEKSHSFIFPGDEIVICSKFDNWLTIAGPQIFGGLNGVVLQSVKCSIIAKKLDVFSEEFNDIFAATRSFELDSFTVPLNGTNAPWIPYPHGGGYAPNINFSQDRNWKLPHGDFKRTINFFTTYHLNSFTGNLDYW